MKITVHVKTMAEVAAAQTALTAALGATDTGEIIVAQPVGVSSAERQASKPAGGMPANQKGV